MDKPSCRSCARAYLREPGGRHYNYECCGIGNYPWVKHMPSDWACEHYQPGEYRPRVEVQTVIRGEGMSFSDDVQKRINDRLKELAQKACRSIGCSGFEPDLCNNHPQDCEIVRKIMGCTPKPPAPSGLERR